MTITVNKSDGSDPRHLLNGIFRLDKVRNNEGLNQEKIVGAAYCRAKIGVDHGI